MEFLNTWALWGFGLASLPIIIHLITRRKALPIEFSAIQFLLRSRRRSERRLKLKQILLLALRILAMIFLASIVARPLMLTSEPIMALEAGEKSIAIIVDTSYSMLAGKSGKAPFDKATSIALSLIDSIGESQEATLIVTSKNSIDAGPVIGLTAKSTELKKAIEGLEVDLGPQDKLGALTLAENLLGSAAYQDREIYFITDMQKFGWAGLANVSSSLSRIYFVDAGNEDAVNISITGMEMNPLIGESRYRAKVMLANRNAKTRDGVSISIELDGEVIARGFAYLKELENLQKELVFKADKPGMKPGKLEIPPDDLAPDNILYFTSFGLGLVNALIIDGDPRTDIMSSETYYLEKALNPRLNARSRINPTVRSNTEITPDELKPFDTVVLTNISSLDQLSLQAIQDFVGTGGGLLFTLGDRIDMDIFNRDFKTLLPVNLRDKILNMEAPLRIEPPRGKDPVSEMFKDPREGDLGRAEIYSRFILEEPADSGDSRVILSFMDGTPCLVTGRIGKGRVGIFATSIDRDWADIAIRPTFLPLMHQTLLYLSGTIANKPDGGFHVGEEGKIGCHIAADRAIISGPDGKTTSVKLTQNGDGTGGIFIPDKPGIYSVDCVGKRGESVGDDGYSFAVNVLFEEGNTERASIDELKKSLGSGANVALYSPGGKVKSGDDGSGLRRKKVELFRYLAAILLAVALLEGAISRSG